MKRPSIVSLCVLALLGLSAGTPGAGGRAFGTIRLADAPYLPGSRIPIVVSGFTPPYDVGLLGPGAIADGVVSLPADAAPAEATLIAGNASGLAMRTFAVGAAPDARKTLIAVATYDDGIAFHRADTFALTGVLATGGSPTDVAFDRNGSFVATDTDGQTIARATLSPWNVRAINGVPLGDEIAIDPRTQNVLVTDRDIAGSGALTRIAPDGSIVSVPTGATAEGIAIDAARDRTYVADVNDGSIAVVQTSTMHLLARIPAVPRDFSLALSADGGRLFVVSNQSRRSPFAAAGRVVEIALDGARPRVVARSGELTFPLGVAIDDRRSRLYVTDEADHAVYVLDTKTLAAVHAPLATCQVPWKPTFDAPSDRLYVPCARSNRVDVFDARTLGRVAGAPFRTAGYPLAVAIWHPRT